MIWAPCPTTPRTRLVFEKVWVPLSELTQRVGGQLQGRRFVDCIVHGPCVVIPDGRTRFETCDLGDAAGDVRNLFLRAVGPMIVGAIPLNDTVFENCIFRGVGFAGDDAFVTEFVAKLYTAESLIP